MARVATARLHTATDPSPRARHRRVRGRLAGPLLATWIVLAGAGRAGTASPGTAAPQGRVIVLGFDGADARTAAEMMDRGELPSLSRLRDTGTFAPLRTTIPAESPVSWASLNSGQNPAKTGVPGFVKRSLTAGGDPFPNLGFFETADRAFDSFELPPPLGFLARCKPVFAGLGIGAAVLVLFALLFVYVLRFRKFLALPLAVLLGAAGGWAGYAASAGLPKTVPDVVSNLCQTGGFWEVAARVGVPSVVLDGPMAWDRPEVPGARVLAGLGVPDARGSYGDWFVYTTDPSEFVREPEGRRTSTGASVFRVDEVDGRIETRVYGLPEFVSAVDEQGNSRERSRLSVPLVVVRGEGDSVRVTLDGVEHTLGPGEWSPWYRPTFEVSSLVKVHAITRVKVLRARDPFELYVDFLQIDPSAPPFWQPVSQPPGFVSELARATEGPFETVGWACLTNALKDREIDPVTFLEDIDATRADRERILAVELARTDWRLLFAVESTPDRVQHMMYQYYDREHPMYDAGSAAQKVRFGGQEIALSESIPAAYRQIDRLVGVVLDQHLRPEDTLILCADHGFQSFRRGLNLNNWLAEHGYLQTVGLGSKEQGASLKFVDWSRTRAYAVGLGMIFVNLRGRERGGIVDTVEVPALLYEMTRDLLATRDGENSVVRTVHRTADIHSGPHLDLESDLMVGLEAGYRVGWSTTTGGMRLVQAEGGSGWKPAPSIEDNTNNWSGDHVSVAQELVPGIFFCNRKVAIPEGGVDLLHIAPTVLALLGVPVPAEYDRPPLVIER